MQDHSIGLIFTLIRLKLILAHISLVSIRNFFKAMIVDIPFKLYYDRIIFIKPSAYILKDKN